MPRPIKPRCIRFCKEGAFFSPIPRRSALGTIELRADEMEAVRLVDHEGMSQSKAAVEMKISRATVWRLLRSGRWKLSSMVIDHSALLVLCDE